MKKTAILKDQVWKKNDQKAQKNGSHGNIYWVRVILYLFRNKLLIKMVLKNQINGQELINMLETGTIIKKMDLGSNTIKMEISMKVDGKIIKDMAKELFGLVMLKIN